MRVFRCSVCDQLVFFENSVCLQCGTALGYLPEERSLVSLTPNGDGTWTRVDGDGSILRNCANLQLAGCNWLVAPDDPEALCRSCRLTSVRPSDDETDATAAFAAAESEKRRLLVQLDSLGLPIVDRRSDPTSGLTFEFLSSRGRPVTTGHESGVITLDLSESDDAHREFVRQQLGEPYRTVLGHLRHEIGHYFWPELVERSPLLDEFRTLFGDERQPYQDALRDHYGGEPPAGWETTHVSQYATMHPWEDWAETFAHYLHIHGGLETADSFGLSVDEPSRSVGQAAWSAPAPVAIGDTIGRWLGVTFALNGMSRSIGRGDLYPFVLSPTVVQKLDFVHRSIIDAGSMSAGTSGAAAG
jgi:hypothetical protein